MYRQRYGSGLGSTLTDGVKGLLAVNITLFFMQSLSRGNFLVEWLGLWPADVWRGAFWQPFTYMFLHGGFMHLLFNMLALWMFGSVLESVWGTRRFLQYYFMTGVIPGLINCIIAPNASYVIVGASGGIYGLLTAYGILFPNSVIYLSFLFPIKAKYLVLLFGAFEFVASLGSIGHGGGGRIANVVHLGGMVVGAVYLKHKEMVRWAARRVKSWQRDREWSRHRREQEMEDRLRSEVDDLLDKINEVGIDNLTPWERRRLREASEELKRRENRP